jgi:peptidoglycan/xylan/chitin deacetylase (PgdA/CDA1 family)
MTDLATEHTYFDSTPIVARPTLRWPNGARVALAFVVCLEHYELRPPPGSFQPPNLPGGFGRGPYPDFRAHSQREYGNRVGIFRVMDALAAHGFKATAAIDAATAEGRPRLVKEIRERGWPIAGHGNALTQVISGRMSEDEEKAHIGTALARIEAAFGEKPRGWHGPEYGESARTPAILAGHGIDYLLDWPNDEQPYRMRTAAGPLLSMPMAIDFDDVFAHWHRRISMARWCLSIADALDQLVEDGARQPRMLILNLHAWLIGQPHRVTYFREMLATLSQREGVWHATTDAIAACATSQLPA